MRLALWYLFALISIPFYIGPEIASNAQINAERAILATLAIAIIMRALPRLIGPPLRALFQGSPLILVMFLGYFTWRLIAAILSPYSVSKYLFINEVLSQAMIFLIFFGLFRRNDFLPRFARIIQISLTFVAITVVVELILGFNVFTALAPEGAGSAILNASIERAGLLRVKGTFEHPLTLGNLVVLLLPLALFCSRNSILRYRFLVGLALIAISVTTGSRSIQAIVAAQVLLFLLVGFNFKVAGRKLYPFATFAPLAPALFLMVLQVVESKTGLGILESYVREAQIRNGLISIQDSPWIGFGAGPGPVTAIFAAMSSGEGAMQLWEANAATVDNWYLSVLLASGWPALFFFIGFGLSVLLPPVFLLSRRRARASMRQAGELGLVLALVIGFASNMALMSVLSIFTLHPLWFIWAAWLSSLSIKYGR